VWSRFSPLLENLYLRRIERFCILELEEVEPGHCALIM